LKAEFSPVQIITRSFSRQIPLLALISLGVLINRRRIRAMILPLAICGYFTLIHAATYPLTRYSDSLHPLLAVMIGAACVELFGARRDAAPAFLPEPHAYSGATRM
jgi:hypothetical protein